MKQGRILSSNKDLILEKMASNDSNTQKKGRTKIDQMSAEVIDSNPYRYAVFVQSFTKWTLTREIYKVIPPIPQNSQTHSNNSLAIGTDFDVFYQVKFLCLTDCRQISLLILSELINIYWLKKSSENYWFSDDFLSLRS